MSVLHSGPTLTLTPREARMLWQAARLDELRIRTRSGDTHLYQLLVSIYRLALATDATTGNETRQDVASDESGTWTVTRVAKAAGIAPRTVRLDAKEGRLPGHKAGQAWTFTPDAVTTYIDTRRKTA